MKYYLPISIILCFTISCVSPALNDDARTLGKTKLKVGGSIGLMNSQSNIITNDTI
jgi:hypothetical protein